MGQNNGSGGQVNAGSYKWVALSNTTLGVLLGFLNISSLILALPVIFRGLKINPLEPGSFNYLLWMLVGYMIVMAVLVVTFGRLGDMFGRTRMYNLGFLIFTVGAILCSVTWDTGHNGAVELILFRIVMGVGAAFLFANSAAIVTDAFPVQQRGFALGLNTVASIAGTFLGIVVGGVLAEIGWRWVFLVNVPLGLAGTIWAYLSLHEIGKRHAEPIDWFGNLTFAAGLTMILTGVIYGINPSSHSLMSWNTPFVLFMLIGGALLMAAFALIEMRVAKPMFKLELFRIRAFAMGNLAGFLSSIARGGLTFLLTIWLQGIWLPMHGYNFEVTPLWAGIYMIPMSLGFLLAGPISGNLSDRFGARIFATVGMAVAAITFALMLLLPVDFDYISFATLIFLNGMAMGMFISPNIAAIMNSVPEEHRGASSGMRATLVNVGLPLSIGVFFTLMIIGLNAVVPGEMYSGLVQHQIPSPVARQLADAPAIGYLFAAFLGYNPLATLIPANVLGSLPPDQVAVITSRTFFPQLITDAFKDGLVQVLIFCTIVSIAAAVASWLQGNKYYYNG